MTRVLFVCCIDPGEDRPLEPLAGAAAEHVGAEARPLRTEPRLAREYST